MAISTSNHSNNSKSNLSSLRISPSFSSLTIAGAGDQREQQQQQQQDQLTPRQSELRAFIQKERLARKEEREMQAMAWEMQHCENEAPVLAVPVSASVSAPVFQPKASRGKENEKGSNRSGRDTFMFSDNTRNGTCNINNNSNNNNNSGRVIQNDLKKTMEEQQSASTCLYEGPPDMEEEEEPIYSTIKKKMTSPTPSFKRPTIHQMMHVAPPSTNSATATAANSSDHDNDAVANANANANANAKTCTSTSTLPQPPPPPSNHENKTETITKSHSAPRLQKKSETFPSFIPIESNTNMNTKSQMGDDASADPASVPIIPLGTYAESAWLEFGDEQMNTVGKSRSLPFDLHVPQDCKTSVFHLKVEKVPVKKGFSLGLVCDTCTPRCELDADADLDADLDAGPASASVLHSQSETQSQSQLQDCTSFTIRRGETKRMFLTWTPTAPGGVCEVAYLKLQRGRVRVTARGHAKAAETKKIARPKSKKNSRFTCTRSRTSSSSLSATKKDTFKPKVNPFETSSSIAGNDYSSGRKGVPSTVEFGSNVGNIQRSWEEYNDDWAVQQCEAYAKWLNHMFQCPEIQDAQCDHSAVTLRTILSTRRWAQASQRAQGHYNCAEMQRMMQTIDNEVCSKRLEIRSDHNVFANVNLRGQMVSLLMSYTTPWLKLGLETMFGETITAETTAMVYDVSFAKRNVCSVDSNYQQKVRGENLCF